MQFNASKFQTLRYQIIASQKSRQWYFGAKRADPRITYYAWSWYEQRCLVLHSCHQDDSSVQADGRMDSENPQKKGPGNYAESIEQIWRQPYGLLLSTLSTLHFRISSRSWSGSTILRREGCINATTDLLEEISYDAAIPWIEDRKDMQWYMCGKY